MHARLSEPHAFPLLPIEHHGVLGDGRSVALVNRAGVVSWWCPGRVDAPSVFGCLLDPRRGGGFQVAPLGEFRSTQRYLEGTNVLVTRFETPTGAAELTDFLAFPHGGMDGAFVRRFRCLEGTIEATARLAPRFGYGLHAPSYREEDGMLVAYGPDSRMLIHSPLQWTPNLDVQEARFALAAGESLDVLLASSHTHEATPEELERAAIERWRAWSSRTRAEGPYADAVSRSVLALKLLEHAPTGAFAAAATTSLPERIGGPRNWDYRFAWLRDGAWTAAALARAGHADEAARFRAFALSTIVRHGLPLRVLYAVDGSTDTHERELEHLDGYHGSKPVRVGNGARTQHQLDVYGEVLAFLLEEGSSLSEGEWRVVSAVADHLVATWRQPDSGIWEMRSTPRHFVLSKALASVGLDRAAAHALARGETERGAQWLAEARAIRGEVEERGYDRERRTYLQAYDHPHLDASNLLLALSGYVDARDERMVGTVEAILQHLSHDGLVHRYRDADDGLEGGEAAFAYCTFWLVEVLALQGRHAEARVVFERMLARASPLQLFAEEIDPVTGAHLGNFPQAFPHAGLIEAAIALREALESAP